MSTEIQVDGRQEYGFPAKPSHVQLRTWTLQEQFLAAYSTCGAVNRSAEDASCSPEAYYKWLDTDVYSFQKRFDLAKARYLERMEVEADRRGVDGIDKPIFYRDQLITTTKQYSDNLLMFRMKKLDPTYRDNNTITLDVSPIQNLLDRMRDKGEARLPEATVIEGSVSETEPSQPPLDEEQPL